MNLKNFLINASQIVSVLEQHDNTPNYQNLISHLTTGRTSPTPEIEKSIKDTVALIAKTNSKQQAALDVVPHSEYVIEQLDISDQVGDTATQRISSIMQESVFNAPTLIEEFVQEISTSQSQLKTILAEVDKFGIEYESIDSALLSIEYLGDYVVEDTETLKARLTDIENIIRAYARLTDKPEAFKKPHIATVSKSSPLIIDIGDGVAIYPTLILVASGIKWAMSRVEQALKIRIQYEELKQKKIASMTLDKEFRSLEEAETSEANIKKFVNELYKEHAPKIKNTSANNGAENEIKKDLLEATRLIVNMIEGGASVKVYPPETKTQKDNEEVSQLVELNLSMSATYKLINKEQGQLKLLESQAVPKTEGKTATEQEPEKPETKEKK